MVRAVRTWVCCLHFLIMSNSILAARTEKRKREAIASIGAATDAAMDSINGGAATVWQNQQQIEAEARLLHQQSQRLAANTAQWVASYQGFHQALKQLGDVENWARAIESDMMFISSSLDGLQQRHREEAPAAPAAVPAAPPMPPPELPTPSLAATLVD